MHFSSVVALLFFMAIGLHAAERPNVILIMADDFGYECVSANGSESYKTPHLDALAASGVRFEHCHAQPLCTPTRVQLMTGRSNVRNYVNFGTLRRSETTFGQVLKQAGYTTGICGKWQLGHEIDSPQHFGFDESFLWQHTRRPPRYANPGLEHNGKELDYHSGEYGPQLVNDFALDFISRHKEKPFFLYYPMMLTHDPFQPTPDSPDWDPKTEGEKAKQNPKHFPEMVAYMDKLIGTLMVCLDDLKLRENTLVLFLGDNGTGKGITTKFKGRDYAGGKGSTHSHGTHVPLIASWPAVMKQGSVCKDLVCTTDFLPTICEATNTPAPQALDGISFLPQLRGEQGSPREWLYHWYSPRQGSDRAVKEWAADQRYKLYRTGKFYDIVADEMEKTPLDTLNEDAATSRDKLQAALDKFEEARPTELDAGAAPGKVKKKKRKNQ
jgi:arylsulfatase A